MKQTDQTDQDDLRPEYTRADFEGAIRGKYAGRLPARRLTLPLQCEQQADGRWCARVLSSPEVSACADSRERAISSAEELAVSAFANRVRMGEIPPTALYFVISDSSAIPRHVSN
jgi:hypothetical protein